MTEQQVDELCEVLDEMYLDYFRRVKFRSDLKAIEPTAEPTKSDWFRAVRMTVEVQQIASYIARFQDRIPHSHLAKVGEKLNRLTQ